MTPIGQAGSMLATAKKEEPVYEGREGQQPKYSLSKAKMILRKLLGLKTPVNLSADDIFS
jgi:hypothetical protein